MSSKSSTFTTALKIVVALMIIGSLAANYFLFQQWEKEKNKPAEIGGSTVVDPSGKPTNPTQELIAAVSVKEESETNVAVIERPVDPITQTKDAAFLDLKKGTKIYARINGSNELIELPTVVTTETKIEDAQVKINEKNTTTLEIRTPERYATFGVGKTFPRHGEDGYSFSYDQPIGKSGTSADVRYDTDDSKVVLMFRFPLMKNK